MNLFIKERLEHAMGLFRGMEANERGAAHMGETLLSANCHTTNRTSGGKEYFVWASLSDISLLVV